MPWWRVAVVGGKMEGFVTGALLLTLGSLSLLKSLVALLLNFLF